MPTREEGKESLFLSSYFFLQVQKKPKNE